jgi:hypothetical protein
MFRTMSLSCGCGSTFEKTRSVALSISSSNRRSTFEDGTRRQVRIVPAIAREGFLLSPDVDTARHFSQLINDPLSSQAPARRLINIQVTGQTGVRWIYQDRIAVSFAELCIDQCIALAHTAKADVVMP